MRVTIDLTEDASFPQGDELPPSILSDDGDVVLTLGDVDIRLTYLQFDRVLAAANEWTTALPPMESMEIPSTEERDVTKRAAKKEVLLAMATTLEHDIGAGAAGWVYTTGNRDNPDDDRPEADVRRIKEVATELAAEWRRRAGDTECPP